MLPQIIGISAVILFLLSYQMKNRRGIILVNAVSRVLYIIQYLLLGAYSGAVLDIAGTLSSVIAGQKHRGFVKKYTALVFISVNGIIILSGAVIALLNKSVLDILPVIGVMLHTSAFWLNSEKAIRLVSLLGSPFWFVYNVSTHAYGSAAGDIFTMISIGIAMIQYKNPHQENSHV